MKTYNPLHVLAALGLGILIFAVGMYAAKEPKPPAPSEVLGLRRIHHVQTTPGGGKIETAYWEADVRVGEQIVTVPINGTGTQDLEAAVQMAAGMQKER